MCRLKRWPANNLSFLSVTITFLTPMLYFHHSCIAFLTRAHNFAEYINSTKVFLHSKYSSVASVRKKTRTVFLKVCWTHRDFLHTSWWFVAKSKATRQSPHYFVRFVQSQTIWAFSGYDQIVHPESFRSLQNENSIQKGHLLNLAESFFSAQRYGGSEWPWLWAEF